MSGKITPAIVAALLLAGTMVASAQAPSAEGAGDYVGAFSGYSGYSGNRSFLYDYAPGYGNARGSDYSPGSSSTR